MTTDERPVGGGGLFDYVFGDRTRLQHPRASDGDIHTYKCERCLNPFETRMRKSGKPRDSIEYEPLRKKLMITDPNHDPVVCDACFLDILTWETHKETPMTDGLPGGGGMPLCQRMG
jgi:hypothetical protein